ncbi:glutamate receptor 2.9-like [Rhodamnia argentea]|uniref:Glutamate receptor n=1 Tax=Rhodamnia argentea TaxID=178133 RepID=A0A8B8QYR9_9MYRT|nr:glutamate receptor 2.9-like [Rhodamnia argentea]
MGSLRRSFSRSSTRPFLANLELFLLLLSLLSLCGGAAEGADRRKTFKVGVILDLDSSLGNQMRMAIEIACQDANNSSSGSYYMKPHYVNSRANPLRSISAAEKLIRKKVRVIIGLETWQEATLVAEIADHSQVPVISFAANHVPPTLPWQTMWPSLFSMSTDLSDQIRCIADIVGSYNRQRVTIIYEAEAYDTVYSELSNSLSVELDKIGSKIEDRVILRAFSSSPSGGKSFEERLVKLKGKASPIFIVLGLSSRASGHFLQEARKIGLFNGDSVWIFAEKPFNNLLASVEHSIISTTMEGAIGLVTHHPENRASGDFKTKFLNKLHQKHGETFNFEQSIDVRRAHDCLMTIKKVIDSSPTDDITPELLLDRLSRVRLFGLSGVIQFEKGQLTGQSKFRIVSVNGNETRELQLWSPNFGFSRSFPKKQSQRTSAFANSDTSKTDRRYSPRMVIGIPRTTPFGKFVKEEIDDATGNAMYVGFCIDIFEKARPHGLNYTFSPHEGAYEDLVDKVHDKTYDAAVGDITILANRSQYVEFTQPYIESELSMIVPAKPDSDRALIFMKPFTPTMWAASGGILIYTMLVVWFLEHPTNPEFRGSRTNQLSTALWFTFSSLFFAHRERINHNFTRIVLVIWFIVALISTQSYTASLTTMLTLQNLQPTVTTMERLRISKARVGCDAVSFVCDYLNKKLNFSKDVVIGLRNSSGYGDQLASGNIAALFLEYPYERAFLAKYCYGYVVTHENYRFGGFGFVFPKGSPLAAKFSEAILKLSESGEMKRLEDKWFPRECTMRNSTGNAPRLGLDSFWALYGFTIATSTGCLLLACLCARRSRQVHEEGSDSHGTSQDMSTS